MQIDSDLWSEAQKIRFLSILAHELTVCARITYEPGTMEVSDPQTLRSFNEIQHRVTGSLRDHFFEVGGMPLPVIVEMINDFGVNHNLKNLMETTLAGVRDRVLEEYGSR